MKIKAFFAQCGGQGGRAIWPREIISLHGGCEQRYVLRKEDHVRFEQYRREYEEKVIKWYVGERERSAPLRFQEEALVQRGNHEVHSSHPVVDVKQQQPPGARKCELDLVQAPVYLGMSGQLLDRLKVCINKGRRAASPPHGCTSPQGGTKQVLLMRDPVVRA